MKGDPALRNGLKGGDWAQRAQIEEKD